MECDAAITVRRAIINDLEEIKRLWLELTQWHVQLQPHRPFREDPWSYRAFTFEQALARPETNWVGLAVTEATTVGMLWCEIRSNPANQRIQPGEYAEIETLTVQADQRNQGIGSFLMRACEEWLAINGISRIVLKVIAENTDAITFYQHFGFYPINIVMEKTRD